MPIKLEYLINLILTLIVKFILNTQLQFYLFIISFYC